MECCMKRFIPSFIGALMLAGCATTYEAPTTESTSYSVGHNLDKAAVMASAKRVLLLDGYQIQSSDDEAGFISTNLKNWRLTPEEADCGATMGLDYLKDNRTKTEVAFNVIVDDESLAIRSNIHGEYKPGAV